MSRRRRRRRDHHRDAFADSLAETGRAAAGCGCLIMLLGGLMSAAAVALAVAAGM